MKRVFIAMVLLVPVAFLINTAFTAMGKEMSIQVDRAQLRSTPAYYGSVVTAVSYADRLKIIDSKGAWVKASTARNNATGWIHISALTSTKLAPKSGAKNAPTSVSAGELSAAEKGFTEQIEQSYRRKNKKIDFTWVDKMEKITISPKQSVTFLKDGQIRPAEGGEP
ncbi:MAG: SH3 domain-containing protein [Chrysiogenales bacterium]